MAYGLRCFDENGKLTLDISDRLSRLLATFSIPTNVNSGTVTLPAYSGQIFVHILNAERFADGVDTFVPICTYTYSISGNILSWSRTVRSGRTVQLATTGYVGVY